MCSAAYITARVRAYIRGSVTQPGNILHYVWLYRQVLDIRKYRGQIDRCTLNYLSLSPPPASIPRLVTRRYSPTSFSQAPNYQLALQAYLITFPSLDIPPHTLLVVYIRSKYSERLYS